MPPLPFDAERVERRFVIGFARGQGTPEARGDETSPSSLTMLALLGQNKRFARPAPPVDLSRTPLVPPDPRPVLPDAARDSPTAG